MINSPTLCQKLLARSLQSLLQKYPNYILYHYINDLLLAAPSIAECDEFRFKSTRGFKTIEFADSTGKISKGLSYFIFKDNIGTT